MFNLLKTITFSLVLSAPTSVFATPQIEKYVEECRIGSNLTISHVMYGILGRLADSSILV